MVELENKDTAKKAIYHALNNDEYTALEFINMDDGTLKINDISEHVRQLERLHNDTDPAEPLDK